MKKFLKYLLVALFFVSCSSDDNSASMGNQLIKNSQIDKTNPLVLNLEVSQLEAEGLSAALISLYSNLFIEIESTLKSNNKISQVLYIIGLNKMSHKLFIDEIKYFSKEGLEIISTQLPLTPLGLKVH